MMTQTPSPSPSTYPCPVCRKPVPVGSDKCPDPNCQVDLHFLAILDTLPASLLELARDRAEKGRRQEAIAALDSLVAIEPENIDAWILLGELHSASANPAEAQRCWRKVIHIQPDQPRAQAELAKTRSAEEAAARKARSRRLLHSLLPAAGVLALSLVVLFTVLPDRTAEPPPTVPPLTQVSPTPTPDLAGAAREAIQDDPALKAVSLEVRQVGSALQLSGELPSQAQKDQLEALLTRLLGENNLVDSTHVSVTPPDLAAQVRLALSQAAGMTGQDVTAEQQGETILLAGTVESLEKKQSAEAAAASVPGVVHVDSRSLVVSPPSFVEKVSAALKNDPRTACFDLSVVQEGPAILLQGLVYSQEARAVVEELARQAEGVTVVDAGKITVQPLYGEYTVVANDNLETVAVKLYGDKAKGALIYAANPGKFPLRVGSVLSIPPADAVAGGLPVVDCTGH